MRPLSGRRLAQAWPAAAAIAALAVSIGAYLAAAVQGRVFAGSDVGSYLVNVVEFHQNLVHGRLFSLWAADLEGGYGNLFLMFHQPLDTYLSELAFLFWRNPLSVVDLECAVAVIVGALGMGRLAAALVDGLFPENAAARAWAPWTAVAGYALSPYLLFGLYERGAYSEITCLGVLPWLVLALHRLNEKPSLKRLAVAAIAVYALAIGHFLTFVMLLPISLIAALLFLRPWLRKIPIAAALALGLAASAHFWLMVALEKGLVRSLLITTQTPSANLDFFYSDNFARLDQVLWFSPSLGADNRFTPSVLLLFGLGAGLWAWARGAARGAACRRLLWTCLFCCAACLYFTNAVSSVWYEGLPWLQTIQFPYRFELILIAAAGLLAVVAGGLTLGKGWQWAALTGLVLAQGSWIVSRHARLAPGSADLFTQENIRRMVWHWEPHFPLPSTVPIAPMAQAGRLAEVVSGDAAADCRREGPAAIQCDVDARTPAVLRANVFDYPGWRALIDGKTAAKTGRDPVHGTMLVALDQPGRRVVRWEFGATPARRLARTVSLAAWLILLTLLLLPENPSFLPTSRD